MKGSTATPISEHTFESCKLPPSHTSIISDAPVDDTTRKWVKFWLYPMPVEKHCLLFSDRWFLCMHFSESLFPDIHLFPNFNMITSGVNLVGCLSPFSLPAGTGAPLGLTSSSDARAEAIALVSPLSAVFFFEIFKLRSLIQLAVLIPVVRMQVISWDKGTKLSKEVFLTSQYSVLSDTHCHYFLVGPLHPPAVAGSSWQQSGTSAEFFFLYLNGTLHFWLTACTNEFISHWLLQWCFGSNFRIYESKGKSCK